MKHAPAPHLIDHPDDVLVDGISLDILMIAACCVIAVAALINLLTI